MKKLVIFGSGGHAKVIFSEVMKLRKFQFLGFVDDFKKKGELVVRLNNKNFYNLGNIKQVINDNKKINGIIGVGLNRIRKKMQLKRHSENQFFSREKNIYTLNGDRKNEKEKISHLLRSHAHRLLRRTNINSIVVRRQGG